MSKFLTKRPVYLGGKTHPEGVVVELGDSDLAARLVERGTLEASDGSAAQEPEGPASAAEEGPSMEAPLGDRQPSPSEVAQAASLEENREESSEDGDGTTPQPVEIQIS